MITHTIVAILALGIGAFIGFTLTVAEEAKAFTAGYTEGAGLNMHWTKMLAETEEPYVEWKKEQQR